MLPGVACPGGIAQPKGNRMQDMTRPMQDTALMVPSGMSGAGDSPGPDPSMAHTAPGSPSGPGVWPLPADSNTVPLPVNVPRRPWEEAAPADRPGSVAWELAGSDAPAAGWQPAGTPSPGWAPQPDGIAE